MIGAFSYGGSVFDIWVMLISGIVGFLMLRHGFSPAPLVMGLILGKMVEESFSQSMIMFDNNWFRFLESPIVLVFFTITILSLGWPLVKRILVVSHRNAKKTVE
jgi:putative tricarboxylic transport membrane protein